MSAGRGGNTTINQAGQVGGEGYRDRAKDKSTLGKNDKPNAQTHSPKRGNGDNSLGGPIRGVQLDDDAMGPKTNVDGEDSGIRSRGLNRTPNQSQQGATRVGSSDDDII